MVGIEPQNERIAERRIAGVVDDDCRLLVLGRFEHIPQAEETGGEHAADRGAVEPLDGRGLGVSDVVVVEFVFVGIEHAFTVPPGPSRFVPWVEWPAWRTHVRSGTSKAVAPSARARSRSHGSPPCSMPPPRRRS